MSECFIYFRFDKVDSVDELLQQLQIKTGPERRGKCQKEGRFSKLDLGNSNLAPQFAENIWD